MISFQPGCHLRSPAILKVRFPYGIIRVSFALDFDVSSDGHVGGRYQTNGHGFAIFPGYFSTEDPVAVAEGLEVFLPYPASAFVGMSAVCPTPESVEDGSVRPAVGFAAAYVLVVVRPASDDRIETTYQVSGCYRLILFDDAADFGQAWIGRTIP